MMPSSFHDAALIQNDDLVSANDRAEPVRNDEAGSAREQMAEGALKEGFRYRIYRAGGFVENEDGRICEQGARKANELALTEGEICTAFTDFGGEPTRQV